MKSRPQNIWGVGRNFKDHASEMKAAIPSQPIIFLKSGASINEQPSIICLPKWAQEVHHEVELAVQISAQGMPKKAALALDLTERHFQSIAKKEGLPWTLAKSFTGATALSPWREWDPDFLTSEICLKINGELRQKGSLTNLIFSIENITHYLLSHFPVCEDDVILMGTPSGVGPLKPGDKAEAEIHFSNGITPPLLHHWHVQN